MNNFDIQEVRETLGELQKILNWYDERGGLMPYDWVSYGHPKVVKLLDSLKVKFDGELKKKDKRGHWR